MAEIFSVNTDLVVGKIESTPGTAESLLSADFNVKLIQPSVEVEIAYDGQGKFASGDHGLDFDIAGAQKATAKASHRLAWSGSYAVAPNSFKFAQACGHSLVEYKRQLSGSNASGQKVVNITGVVTGNFVIGQTVTLKEGANTENCVIANFGASSLTMVGNLANSYTVAGYLYTGIALQPLKATDATTMTIAAYALKAGVASAPATAIKMSGALGTIEVSADGIGKPIMVKYDFTGKYSGYTDVTYANVPVFSGNCDEVADTLIGSTLTIGGTAQKVSKLSLVAGNAIEVLSDQSDSSGYLQAIIAKREPSFTCDPIRQTVATDDVITDALTNDGQQITLKTAHFTIVVPKAQLTSPKQAERDGVHSWEKHYRLLRNCTALGAALDTVIPVECAYEIIHGVRC